MKSIISSLTKRDQKGFTLIELLVVIAIIAILAALILAALSSAQKGSRDSKRKSDLNQYKTALVQYESDKQKYPNAGSIVNVTGEPCASLIPGSGTKYLTSCLNDPKSGSNYSYISSATGDSTTGFAVCANLERESGRRQRVSPTFSGDEGGAATSCTASE